jgi:transcriptional regulator with XRE-family HTH domain
LNYRLSKFERFLLEGGDKNMLNAKLLKGYLAKEGMNQGDLAEFLQMSQATISYYLTGKTAPDIVTGEKICDRLKIPMEERGLIFLA